ncbi:MAG: MaoC family dehydratase N-terminal domain-containing protein [Myxococcota bacterium]
MAIPARYKNLIGKATKPKTFEVEKGQVRRFALAIGETKTIHSEEDTAQGAGYSSLVGTPTFVAALSNIGGLYETLDIDQSNTMHAEEEYEFFRPVVAGDQVTVTHKVVDIYDKDSPNGKLVFVVIETRGADLRDRPVFKGRRVLVELKR